MDDCVLSDATVWLSRPVGADVDAIVACCRQPSIAEWTVVPAPYRRGDAEQFLREVVNPGWAARSPTWALRSSATGPVIGMIGLSVGAHGAVAEIGFWLDAAMRGRGLMTRSVRLVRDFGFAADGLGLTRIEWQAYVGNLASAAVARRAGFHYEGLLRRAGEQRGMLRDSWIAARLNTDTGSADPGWAPVLGAAAAPG